MPSTRELRLALLSEADFYLVGPLVRLLEELLDGSAFMVECLTAAMQAAGAEHAAEAAARKCYAATAACGNAATATAQPPELLLRPFSSPEALRTFAYEPDAASGQLVVLPHSCGGAGVPLLLSKHRQLGPPGQRSVCHSQEAYQAAMRIFNRGALGGLPSWSGVIVAGGAALAPLLRLPPQLDARVVAALASRPAGPRDGSDSESEEDDSDHRLVARMNAYDAELYSDLACHFHGGGIEDSYGDDDDGEPFLDPYDFGCVCAKPRCAKKPCCQQQRKGKWKLV